MEKGKWIKKGFKVSRGGGFELKNQYQLLYGNSPAKDIKK